MGGGIWKFLKHQNPTMLNKWHWKLKIVIVHWIDGWSCVFIGAVLIPSRTDVQDKTDQVEHKEVKHSNHNPLAHIKLIWYFEFRPRFILLVLFFVTFTWTLFIRIDVLAFCWCITRHLFNNYSRKIIAQLSWGFGVLGFWGTIARVSIASFQTSSASELY